MTIAGPPTVATPVKEITLTTREAIELLEEAAKAAGRARLSFNELTRAIAWGLREGDHPRWKTFDGLFENGR